MKDTAKTCGLREEGTREEIRCMLRKVMSPFPKIAEMKGHRFLPPPQVSAVLKYVRVGIERKKKILLSTAGGSEVAHSKGPPERSGKRME